MSFSEPEEPINELLSGRFRTYLPVVIDVETGGFNSKTDAILEVAAVIPAMDENGILTIEQTFFHRVVPFEGANLEEAALKFTGIDPYHPLRIAKSEKEVIQNMFTMVKEALKAQHCKRAILVGHNAHFDHGFINAASERHNLKRNPFHPFSSFDTATLSGLVWSNCTRSRLPSCRH